MKKDKSNFKQLAGYYKRYSFLSIMMIILIPTYALVALLSPIYEGKLLGLFGNFNENEIIKTAFILLLIRLGIEVVSHVWSTVALNLNAKVNYDLKKDMLESVTNLETKNFDNTNSGVFISRLNKDTTELSELFDVITDRLAECIVNIGFIVYVFFINIYLGLFLVFNVIIFYMLSSKQLTSYKKNRKEYKEKDEKTVGLYSDTTRGIREIKNLGLKSVILPEINKVQKETIDADKNMMHKNRLWARLKFSIQDILDFIFILLSVYFIANNKLEASSFMIVFLYKNKVLYLTNCVAQIREKLAEGKVAAERVFDVMNYETFSKETFGTTSAPSLNGNIEFKNVDFSYNTTKLFDNLSFKVEPNKMTAIVGKSGEGKSTILKLIDKNYNIDGGQILIDGYDINDLTEDSLRNNISIVSQSPYIFNLSIKDNIKLAAKDATDEEIIEVCKQAQIHSDIISMEDGYNTVVGENGVILSGGQKQRVAIARALIKKTNIILFDEATSALDNSNQEKIKNVIRDLSKDHTIIIVAHRLSTIVDSDDILVVANHKICAHATHERLILDSKEYRKLYEMEE